MQYYVDPKAKVHPNVIIRPGAWIGPNVEIDGGVVIGHSAIIGGQPEHRDFYSDTNQEDSLGVHIKAGARVFEFVTIHAGTRRTTVIGENAAVFNHSHVAHDCIVGKGATIGGQVSLAGHCYIMEGANVSGKSCLVQFCTVGAYAFIGGLTYITNSVGVGEKWLGFPARFIGYNDVGLQRAGMTIGECKDKFEQLYMRIVNGKELP